MTGNEKSSVQLFRADYKEIVRALSEHLFWAVAGFFAARGSIDMKMAPFGLSVVAGTDIKHIPFAAVGAALGYFIPVTDGSVFRYFAALCAITAIRLIIGGIISFKKGAVWNFVIGFGVTTATSIASVIVYEAAIITALAEGLLVGIGAYFITLFYQGIYDGLDSLKDDELVAAAVLVNMMLLGLFGLEIQGISLGRILAVVFVLLASKSGRIEAGAICGISVSVFLMLYNPLLVGSAIIFSVAGVAASIISRRGRVFSAVAFMCASSICVFCTKPDLNGVLLIVESFFGAGLSLILPEKVYNGVAKLFSPPVNFEAPVGLKGALLSRLSFASDALGDISETVDRVAGELSKINTPDRADVILKIQTDACTNCRLFDNCWKSSREVTIDAINEMGSQISSGSTAVAQLPPEQRERCIRREKFESAVNANYREFLTRLEAESRIKDVRDVVSDQFGGISQMLCDLAEEFTRDEKYDTRRAYELTQAFKNIGIKVKKCGCRIDRFGRISIEMCVSASKGLLFNRMRMLGVAEAVLGREFEPPIITENTNEVLFHFHQKPEYTAITGVAQLNSEGAMVCGDAYSFFNDGRGHYVMVLSDGMGTGGRAAVDSAMASGLMSRLIKAGFGFDCSLKMLNSSMLFKSTDESLATVDIVSMDLFNGKTELLKAGAAPTFVLRSGKTGKAESTSLPAGIIREIAFDKASITLKEGDVVVMLSDGASATGTEWISKELNDFDGNVQAFAEKIANMSRKRRDDGHEDDITVICAKLEKAI